MCARMYVCVRTCIPLYTCKIYAHICTCADMCADGREKSGAQGEE